VKALKSRIKIVGCVEHVEDNIVVDLIYTEPVNVTGKLTSNKILIYKITHFEIQFNKKIDEKERMNNIRFVWPKVVGKVTIGGLKYRGGG
jgi:hypothetical protein